MTRSFVRGSAVALLLLVAPLALGGSAAAQTATYAITELAPTAWTPGYGLEAVAINDDGQVVGTLSSSGCSRAVVWSAEGGLRDLGSCVSWAAGIDDNGQVVGGSIFPGTPSFVSYHAVMWDEGGGMRDLGTLPGFTDSKAGAINDNGQVVGTSSRRCGRRCEEIHVFLWQDGAMRDIAPLSAVGASGGEATGINNRGQVVGYTCWSRCHVHRAFVWEEGRGLRILDAERAHASAINNQGQMVGWVEGSSGRHAFVWQEGVGMRDLGTLPGDSASEAWGIDDAGRVVGRSRGRSGVHAFLYSDGVMTDLNSLLPAGSGWTLWEARRINAAGQILGSGQHNGKSHEVLLTPSGDEDGAAPAGERARRHGRAR